MKHSYVSVNRLVPTQRTLLYEEFSNLAEGFDPSLFKPIPVLEHNGKFFLGGGHHRAGLIYLCQRHYRTGRLMAPVTVAETDQDIQLIFEEDRSQNTRFGFTNKYDSARQYRERERIPTDIEDMKLLFIESTSIVGVYLNSINSRSGNLIFKNAHGIEGSISRLPNLDAILSVCRRAA
jgi:hypothetical protein